MNLSGRILLVGLAAPALGARPGEQAIRFDPEPDTRVARSLDVETDFGLDGFGLDVDGEDLGPMLGGLDCSITSKNHVVVSDRYVSLGDGRPTELLRTFDELEGALSISFMSELGSQDQDMSCASELEGSTVRFLWDAEDGAYRVTFEDGASDAVLEGLVEDMDCRALLPREEVEVGDTWEVPLSELTSIASPGGELMILPEGADIDDLGEFEELFADELAALGELLEGRCVCTYAGLEKDDPGLARIDVTIEVQADVDLSEAIFSLLDTIMAEVGEEEMPEVTIDTADLKIEFEGAGTLLWNVEQGRLASFDAGGDVAFSVDFSVSFTVGEESHDAELFVEMNGSLSQRLKVE